MYSRVGKWNSFCHILIRWRQLIIDSTPVDTSECKQKHVFQIFENPQGKTLFAIVLFAIIEFLWLSDVTREG